MSRVVMAHALGGPEVLRIENREIGEPGPGEVRIRHTAIGVNFADLLLLEGRYTKPDLPSPAGREAAAIVEAVGPDVSEVKLGQRVCYISVIGAFADKRIIAAENLYPIPDEVDDKIVAAVMLKGMTAEYLLHATYALKPGQTVLVHAAAGGVGSMLAQWASNIGAIVIGTVGSDEKIPTAMKNGCDHVINYSTEDFAARTKALTDGKGVDVIYDGVGKNTFEGNMEACGLRGFFINYGHSSGVPGPIDAMRINAKSMYFNKSNMFNYALTREIRARMLAHVFEKVSAGVLKPEISRIYALNDVVEALGNVVNRKTTGATIIVP